MNTVYIIRENLQGIYAKYSKVIDKAVQFALALLTFWVINQNVGFMKTAAEPVVAIALAVICTFLPMNVIIIVATLLILVHMYAYSWNGSHDGSFVSDYVYFLFQTDAEARDYRYFDTTCVCI